MQPVALTFEATQQALRKRLDSPTRPAPPDVGQTPRNSARECSHSCLPRGSFPGWPSPVSSPLVVETIWVTSSQVSFLPPSSLTPCSPE